MSKNVRTRGSLIRNFLLETLSEASRPMTCAELSELGAEKFSITKSAVAKHLRGLKEQGTIEVVSQGRSHICSLKQLESFDFHLPVNGPGSIDEMLLYVSQIKPRLTNICDSAENILEYGFTEMLNNVCDHSGATEVTVIVTKTAISTTICIIDNGIGIFRKVKEALKLPDERQSLLELSKGKFTTDPANHTGEGIFFTSRACDHFAIFSNGLVFTHSVASRDLLHKTPGLEKAPGTMVIMSINNNSNRRMRQVFDRFSSVEEGFTKTEVPVKLVQYENEGLTSRSQAKRLLARIDRFKYITLDFEGVQVVGQAFADQVFRVFVNAHPGLEIRYKNANKEIEQTIKIAQNNKVG